MGLERLHEALARPAVAQEVAVADRHDDAPRGAARGADRVAGRARPRGVGAGRRAGGGRARRQRRGRRRRLTPPA
eukprot:977457-Prymnesium_polylepis.1